MAKPITDPRSIHARLITNGINPTPQNRAFFNNLITLYSKTNLNSSALRLFNSIPCPNTVTWTAVISAFPHTPNALRLFLSMLRHHTRTLPNARTLSTLLKTCASLSDRRLGPQLHSLTHKLSLNENPFVGSALVSLYCKTRDLDSARKVFDEMPDRDEACFSSIINGLAQNKKPVEALRCFAEMRRRNLLSTLHSLSGALSSASKMAMLDHCSILHGHAVVMGLNRDVYVGTGLIDAYGKCGVVEDAGRVFEELETELNLTGWNAMMSAYALMGCKDDVIRLFREVESRGLEPDRFTFLAVLTAFSNSGMAVETEMWLSKMKTHYGIEPKVEHYTCLMGALGRVGKLDEAERVALSMPYEPDAAVWRVLLSSCVNNRNPSTARRMSDKLLEINPNDDSAYVILANVFASCGDLDELKRVRKMMRENGVRKEIGRSWVEVQGNSHVFFAGDKRHVRRDEIYEKLKEMMVEIEKLGYVSNFDEMYHELEEKEKRELLWFHSEKLAVAFGLLSGVTPNGKPLRITKNLRICRDCHEAFKYVSVVEKKEIIARDVHRYHRFLNGTCCCDDSW